MNFTTFVVEDSPWRAIELGAADVLALQRFFDANPVYFETVGGQPAEPDEAQREFDDRPPAGMAYEHLFLLGFVDEEDELVGMASIVSHLLARDVWHIGFFIVGSALHGSGAAREIYEALESWIRRQGAQWIRMGVVKGNSRGERFWAKLGYLPTRERGPVTMGLRENLIQALVKPLRGGALADYLALVQRDNPGAP